MKKNTFCFIGLFLPVVLLTTSPSTQRSGIAVLDTIPFELTSHNNTSIKAVLNGQDTLRLMLHTAVESVSLIRSSTDGLKNINWSDKYDVESWGGKTTARYSGDNSLSIGTLKWEHLPLWESENSGPETDGKFGLNLFEGQVVEIDFDKSVLILHQSLPEHVKTYKKRNIDYKDGLMFVKGISRIKSNTYKNQFLIHSGFGGTLLFDDQFVATHGLGSKMKLTDEQELKDSYGNVVKTKKAILPSFLIGSLELRDLEVGFFEGAIGRQRMSVLGGDVLKRFNIIFDKRRKHIYLKPNAFFSQND